MWKNIKKEKKYKVKKHVRILPEDFCNIGNEVSYIIKNKLYRIPAGNAVQLIFIGFICLYVYVCYSYSKPPIDKNNGANTSDTIVISLTRILIDGPDVSLNGSPTVSPTTAAL